MRRQWRPCCATAPFGTLRKRWEHDKEGVAQVVPIPRALREAFDAAGVVGKGPVFPAARTSTRCWSRSYARDLLERAERLAGLTALEGGDWHPYRRLWATERKGLPVGDVMLAGGWQDERTLRKYQLADPETMKAVMLFDPDQPTTQTAAESGTETGTRQPKTRRLGGRASA